MSRHYCVSCDRKIMEHKMKLLKLPFVRRTVWVCLICYAKYINHTVEVES